jgi:hypothetical protein
MADETAPGTQAQPTPVDTGKVPLLRSTIVLLLALMMGLVYWFDPPVNIEPQAGVIMDLPTFVGNYFGKEGQMTSEEIRVLPKDTQLVRRFYDDSRGHEVNCSIVLSGAEQRSIHRPEACLVGQGWTNIGQKEIPIPLKSGHKLIAEEITLERQVTDRNGGVITVRAFYDYWFVGQNVTTYSEMWRVLSSNWDRVFYNQAHRWAYVSVFSLVSDNLRPDGLNADQTRSMLVDFSGQIVPSFQISEMPAQAKN